MKARWNGRPIRRWGCRPCSPRARDGGLFGLARFTDYIIRATAAGELAPETLRRLIHSILEAQPGQLRDDATIVMFEWWPPAR